jgi:23S rRNA pseudouridine1911/1915/1917 synthase
MCGLCQDHRVDGRTLEITAELAGQRLDVLLASELGISRGYVRRLLRRDRVRISGRPGLKGMELRAGDRVEIEAFRHPDEGPIASPELPLRVIEHQGGLIAIAKPAGYPTHPLDFEETETMLNAVLARFPRMLGVGEGGLMSGVVHRLDTDTSGVLIFAEEDAAWRRARRAFETRRAEKRYVARVHGAFHGEREVELRLAHRGKQMRVVASGGRVAHTWLQSIRVDADSSLIEARPSTGLMHQLRVTLAQLGHPVLGDSLYGSELALDRHLLHAVELRIEDFRARCEVPAEFDLHPD